MFTAQEVMRESDIARDRHVGPVADMLAYCAEVLRCQERHALARAHTSKVETAAVSAPVSSAEYLSVADVAARFNVSRNAVHMWIRRGRVDTVRTPGGRRLVTAASLPREGELTCA